MKKQILFLVCSFLFCACQTIHSYTFDVDAKEVILNTSYSLEEKEDEIQLYDSNHTIHGMFIDVNTFNRYYESVQNDQDVQIVSKQKDSIIWRVNEECNYIVKIDEDCAMLFGSLDDVEKEYKNLSFEVCYTN